MTAVIASLQIFSKTTIDEIRRKSLDLTGYLEHLLLNHPADSHIGEQKPFTIITPADSAARGAQLSVRLDPGLMEGVFSRLLANGVILDERKPDVIRVAPAPLYNSYSDVWEFVQVFRKACQDVIKEKGVSA